MLPLQLVSHSLPANAPHEDSPLVSGHAVEERHRPGRWWQLRSYDHLRQLAYGGLLAALLTFILVASLVTVNKHEQHAYPPSAAAVKDPPSAIRAHHNVTDVVPMDAPAGGLAGAPAMYVGPDARLGVCYDPVHHWAYPGNMGQVFSDDMPLIARNFRAVRTFYSQYYGVDIMPFIANAGLRASLGVSIANGQADGQKGAAIRAWYSHGANLNSVLVGNEDIHPVGPFSVDDIIYHIEDLRKAGLKCPIGTVQRINEWLTYAPEIDRLAAASDIIGVNIYPYFSTPHNGGEAWEMDNVPVENMRKQFEAVRGRFPGQEWKVRIMETGWPTRGSRNFAGHDSSLDMGAKYYFGFVGWACQQDFDSYFYEYFDKRWGTNPDYEQFFGVADADGNLKYQGMSNGYC